MISVRALGAASLLLAVSFGGMANASFMRVAESNFTAAAGLITMDEFPVGTVNPTFAPSDYGGGAGSPTVTTGGYFQGQSLSTNPTVDCPGAAATACVVGSPTGPLTLDVNAPDVFITTDGAFPSSPTLSGTPRFNGPIALLFSEDQFGVGFDAGYFDAPVSTGITAFRRDGTLIGTVANQGTGIEFLGLISTEADIAGVFLDLVGSEPAGFNIDNVRFGVRGQVRETPVVPVPAALPLMLGAIGGLGLMRRRRRG